MNSTRFFSNNSRIFLAALGFMTLFSGSVQAQTSANLAPAYQASASEQSQATPDMRKIIKGLDLSRSQKRSLRKLLGESKAFRDEVEQRERELKTLIESGNSREADFLQDLLETDQGAHHQEFRRKLSAILTPDQRAQMAALQNQ
jgi:Spy/CpxP family protein refolding chaperone